MAIQYSHNCMNCKNLMENNYCSVHQVMVSGRYTCEKFNMKDEFLSDRNCTNCKKYETSDCAHPDKAAPGMLCRSWTPNAVN